MKKVRNIILGSALGLFLAIQLVPYGRTHSNPPLSAEPNWSDPQARELFMRSCGDCHSNETKWPWYSQIAPISWRVQEHVDEGREKFNISEWGREGENEGEEAAEEVEKGSMPLRDYLLMHPSARLDETEKEQLIQYLKATFGEEAREEGKTEREREGKKEEEER